jgi:chloramphenicol-sensitive protein RarD
LALAGGGVVFLAVEAGEFPWIAATLAASFGTYALIRKSVRVDGVTGVTVETILLAPAALAYLGWLGVRGEGVVPGWGLGALLLLSGVVTAVPLVCFSEAARRLPLSTLGFIQYLSPSVSFVVAVAVFGEPFRLTQGVCFGCIWAALAIYGLDSLRAYRGRIA